jgi:hypothetical protein
MKTLLSAIILFAGAAAGAQTIIHVPADQPTIQAGIDAAVNGDTVLVAPGTYFENIDFHGKLIKVTSSDGPKATIIDGGQKTSVVTFSSGEGRKAILMGFTLTHGFAGSAGGGISIGGSSPSIVNNVITQNSACSQGGGIFAIGSAPLILGNVISKNFQQGCIGGEGAGIMVENGAAGLQIIGNRILNNIWGEGAGMDIRAFGNTLIESNLIMGNIAKGESPSRGGGMLLQASSINVIAVQNVVAANQADQGAGIYWAISGGTTPMMLNNTIANNRSTQTGSALYIAGITSDGRLINNLFIGGPSENAVFCDATFTNTPPLFRNNDAWSFNAGTPYAGNCAGQTGKGGNISRNPIFSGLLINDYRLRPVSPAIDTGLNSAPGLPANDIQGQPRIFDGNFDGTATVDMGAYEFEPPN